MQYFGVNQNTGIPEFTSLKTSVKHAGENLKISVFLNLNSIFSRVPKYRVRIRARIRAGTRARIRARIPSQGLDPNL